jgi:TonB family protein
MKTCPKCQMQYDEEVIRFCTKDGTPLVTEEKPDFSAMPSESLGEDELLDIGEETIIRRNRPANIPPPVAPFEVTQPIGRPAEEKTEVLQVEAPAPKQQQRVVIPVGEERKQEIRPAAAPPQHYSQTPPKKSNTALVVALTLLGTLAVIGGGLGVWWLMGGGSSTVANSNVNGNSNLQNSNANYNANAENPFGNYNIGSNGNFNTNVNANANVNSNVNANTKTPTPKPTVSPKPSQSPDANANVNANSSFNASPANTVTPDPRPTLTVTPTPKPTATPTAPQNVNVGVINSRASNLVKPAYPSAAKQMGASGPVQVAVTVDENGNVLSARATSGHPLLRQAAEAAARQSRFNPIRVGDRSVRASGTILYNFIKE